MEINADIEMEVTIMSVSDRFTPPDTTQINSEKAMLNLIVILSACDPDNFHTILYHLDKLRVRGG